MTGKRATLFVTTVLVCCAGLPPNAHADEPAPLHQLVDTAAQRLLTADPVAAVKWIDGGSIEDPKRVAAVLDSVRADASAHQVDAQYVQRAFEDQIRATEGVEYIRFGQWKLDPASAPSVAPDLSTSRAAIDGFNRAIVNEIAVHWDALHGPACTTELTDAVGAVVTARELDPLYQQALSFATSSYCETT